MVFNATFNNISVILWRSVLLVEETGENHQPTYRKSLTKFITKCCIEYTSPWAGIELTTSVAIGTDCTGSCRSNYHTITATTAPKTRSFMKLNILFTLDRTIIKRLLTFPWEQKKITKMNYNIPFKVRRGIIILSVTFSLTELCNRQTDWLINFYSYQSKFVMIYYKCPLLLGQSTLVLETCNLHTNKMSNLSDIWTGLDPMNIYLYVTSVTIIG